jgi:Na+-translocating ferredoxin:NAD+ oxidoreductase RNF subunit RnfB
LQFYFLHTPPQSSPLKRGGGTIKKVQAPQLKKILTKYGFLLSLRKRLYFLKRPAIARIKLWRGKGGGTMDYESIVRTVLFMFALAIVIGPGLIYLGEICKVMEDRKIEEINGMLPQKNCGACGFPGCPGLAKAMVEGKANPGDCTQLKTEEEKQAIADCLGVVVISGEKKFARVACQGGTDVAGYRADFPENMTCFQAKNSGGIKKCPQGCLGLGDCEKVCEDGAITMSKFGLPIVDTEKCTACGKCVSICPKKLFSVVPASQKLFVACKNIQIGIEAKKECLVACTGCGNCAADAPKGLIKMIEENSVPVLAVIDYESGLPQSEKATKNCPTGAIVFRK